RWLVVTGVQTCALPISGHTTSRDTASRDTARPTRTRARRRRRRGSGCRDDARAMQGLGLREREGARSPGAEPPLTFSSLPRYAWTDTARTKFSHVAGPAGVCLPIHELPPAVETR